MLIMITAITEETVEDAKVRDTLNVYVMGRVNAKAAMDAALICTVIMVRQYM